MEQDITMKEYKYLDIEKEGFVFKYEERRNPNKLYTKPYKNNPRGYLNRTINVIYNNRNNWVLIYEGTNKNILSNLGVRFSGNIYTQKDFKKILNMIIIDNNN